VIEEIEQDRQGALLALLETDSQPPSDAALYAAGRLVNEWLSLPYDEMLVVAERQITDMATRLLKWRDTIAAVSSDKYEWFIGFARKAGEIGPFVSRSEAEAYLKEELSIEPPFKGIQFAFRPIGASLLPVPQRVTLLPISRAGLPNGPVQAADAFRASTGEVCAVCSVATEQESREQYPCGTVGHDFCRPDHEQTCKFCWKAN